MVDACPPPIPQRPRAVAVAPHRGNSVVILLVDPRPLMRECLSRLLQTSVRDFRVVPVSDPAEASERGVLLDDVDLVLLSVGGAAVTGTSAGEAISVLRQALPDTPIIVLSDCEAAEHVVEAIRRGARGYIPTSLSLPAAIEALRFVRAGGTFVPASVIGQAAPREHEARNSEPSGDVGAACLDRFTARELEVLALLRLGRPNKVIAYELNMQETTLKVHIRHIKNKLGVANRTEVALICQRLSGNQAGWSDPLRLDRNGTENGVG